MSTEPETRSLRSRLEQFGLDLRSLALFRVLIGVLLIFDLLERLGSLRAFYSDEGLLPRGELLGDLASGSTPWHISIHEMSGLWQVQALLFAIAILFAFCLIVGFRTRWMTFLCWLLLMSLHNRNLLILNAGDGLLRILLFWGMFLPLGARGSVDAALTRSTGPIPTRSFGVPAVCFMIQLCVVYWATAFLKSHPIWTEDRTAVWHSLQLDYMTRPLAGVLGALPREFLELSTSATLVFEFLAPFLIWVPFFVGGLRLLAVVLFVGLHATFAATFDIGLFSYVCIAMWCALIPSLFWDRLNARWRRSESRLALTVYYDGTCGFCRRMVLILRALFLLPETRILTAQEDPDIEAKMRERNSWVVVGADGVDRFRFRALAYVIAQSTWAWPLGRLLSLSPFVAMGTPIYEWVARNRSLLGRWTSALRERDVAPAGWPLLRVRDVLLLATLCYVLAWNARGLHLGKVFDPGTFGAVVSARASGFLYSPADDVDRRWIGNLTRLGQKWSMFAPYPRRMTGWFVAVGTLEDGTEVDLYRHVILGEDSPAVSWDRPDRCIDNYPGPRWRKYLLKLPSRDNRKYRFLLNKYLAREWKREFGESRPLEKVQVYFLRENIRAYEPNSSAGRDMIWRYTVKD